MANFDTGSEKMGGDMGDRDPITGIPVPIENPGAMPEESPAGQAMPFEGRDEPDEGERMRSVMNRSKNMLGAAMDKAGVAVINTRKFIREKRNDVSPNEERALIGAVVAAGAIKWARGIHRGDRSYNTPHMPSLPHRQRTRRASDSIMRHLPGRKSGRHFMDLRNRFHSSR